MADKQKKGSDTLKFQRKVVLSGLRSSQYVRKKYTLKNGFGHIHKTGSYVEVGGRMTAEEAADRNKGKNQKKHKARNTLSFAPKGHSREKRAAYIKENIQNDLAASYEEKSDEPVSPEEELQELSPEKTDEKQANTDGSVSAEKDADKAERMKKAAYIKEKLQRDIAAKKAASFSKSDDIPDNFQSPPGTETNGTAQAEKNEVSFESRFLGNSEHISENKYKSSLDSAEVRQAYKAKILEAQMNRRKDAVIMHSQAQTNAALISAEKAKMSALKNAEAEEFTRDNVVPGIEMAAGYISAVKNGDAVGMITQPAVSVIKNNMGSLGGITDSVSTISGAVQNSDSIGGAVANVGTSLAAGKLRSAVSNYLFKPSDAKIEERLEKKFRCIDRKTDRQMSRIQKGKAEAMNGNISKKLEKKLDKVERDREKYKQKIARQQKELQRRQQKNIYIKHNRNNPAFVGNKLKRKAAGAAGKSKLLLLGSGTSFLVIILIIIILLILIASLFSWLTPFDFSLAGDDSGEQTAASTEEEIIDGYAKLIQNYMDVTQAYYYLEYGDWYGGVYDYPAPDISFSDFLAEFQSKVISDIQERYSAAFAAAKTSEEISAISQAMSAEISAALQASVYQARIEYDALMEALDDSMRATERRQHYEVYDGGGGNGVQDSSEFTGMPIVGTNHFGNVEIQSELSAEELLAMTALYKSLKIIGGNDEDDADEAVVYNITTDDIMEFFKETEFISITANVTHNHLCGGNCKRRLIGDYESGYSWEYYCENGHDNLNGEIGACKTKDELTEKILELTNAEDNGVDAEAAEEIIEAYLDTINEKLSISESDYRQFGAADNERAKAFYEMLIDPEQGEIPNNFWTVETPFNGEET